MVEGQILFEMDGVSLSNVEQDFCVFGCNIQASYLFDHVKRKRNYSPRKKNLFEKPKSLLDDGSSILV